MPRSRPGQGSIIQRRDGRWQISLQVNGVRRTVYATSEREARAKLRQLQAQVATDGALTTPGRRTVADLIDAWLSNAPNLKPATIAQHRWFFDTYVRADLGRVRLERVTPDQLQRLYARLTPSVASTVHRMLHRAFAVAVLWRWLPANPCDRVLPPAYKPQRKTLWTQDQLAAFLTGAAEHWLYPLWLLLLSTGLRLGEALALRWDDAGMGVAVTVSGTLRRLDGQAVVTPPKTPAARRTVLLPPPAIEALKRQQAQQAAWRTEAREGWHDWQDSGFVFTSAEGKPLWASTVQHALKRECERLGLPPVTPHGLRHLHASLLLHEGVPVPAVSARLGHANPQVTMSIYAHALAGQDAVAATAIGRVLERSIVPSAP